MKKSTLDSAEIYPGRQVGNSTRLVDAAINLLFEGFVVEVKDHVWDGKHKVSNDILFDRVIRRLKFEHGLVWLIRHEKIRIDRDNHTIELLQPPKK